jgi:hypothetical protein
VCGWNRNKSGEKVRYFNILSIQLNLEGEQDIFIELLKLGSFLNHSNIESLFVSTYELCADHHWLIIREPSQEIRETPSSYYQL